jgi:hypothetical protein
LQNLSSIGSLSVTNVSVGQNLQTTLNVSLPVPAGPGGATINISSGAPTRLTLGSVSKPSIIIAVPEGETDSAVVIQSVGATGAVQVTASASGLADGIGTVTITPSGFVLESPNGIGAPFQVPASESSNLTVYSARLDASGRYVEKQALRASMTAPVNVDVTSVPFGSVTPASVTFNPNATSAQTTFSATTTGTATITAVAPAGFATPADQTNVANATVLSRTFTLPSGLTVGKNLQVPATVALEGVAPDSGLQVTITSDNSSKLLFSSAPGTAGTGSLVLTLPGGARGTPEFYVQALDSSGTVSYTVQAAGFGSKTGSVTLAPSAILFTNAFGGVPNPILVAVGGASAPVQVYSGRVDASGALVARQAIAGGKSATVTVTNIGNANVGSVNPAQVTISNGANSASTQFQPGTEGNTTLQLSVPAGFNTPATAFRQIGVSVTRSRIILTANGVAVGNNLQTEGAIVLNQPAPSGGLAVTLTSNSPQQLRLSSGATLAGPANGTLVITVPEGETTVPYYVQALAASGTISYKASASGYVDGEASVSLTPSGVVVSDTIELPFITVAKDETATALVSTAQLDPVTRAYVITQPLRGGMNLSVTLSTMNGGIASVTTPVAISGGTAGGNATVTGKGIGTTTLTVTQPAGFEVATNGLFAGRPMPSITVNVF